MSITPEYGEEERMQQQEERESRDTEGVVSPDRPDLAEREIQARDREERELVYLQAEDNEAHAAGQVCERCGTVITANQDVRLLPDGHWIHEVCPTDLGRPAVSGPGL
jgi:hypothetical protein